MKLQDDRYMGNPRLQLASMSLLLPVIHDISDPPSQFLVNPRDPRAKKKDKNVAAWRIRTKLTTDGFFFRKKKMPLHLGKARLKKTS